MTEDSLPSPILPAYSPNEIIDAILQTVDARESTKTTYRYGLRHFLRFCDSRHHSRSTLLEYKQSLSADNTIKAATKRLYLNSAKLLYRQLYYQGHLPKDISATVRGFTITREHKADAISEEQVQQVFRYLADKNDIRLRAIFTLLYFQGLRRGEVVRLRIENYHPNAKTMAVVGKGRDDAESVDLHAQTLDSINAYLKGSGLKSGWLFPSTRSEAGHMSEVQLHRLVQQVHKRLGIDHTVHAWRKAFTSVLIDSGMDLISVSKFTRHKSTHMLDVYYSRADKKKKLPAYQAAFTKSLKAQRGGEGQDPLSDDNDTPE